ncbi:MAG: APC family permease [Candidatus Bathyarchaeota archaeon]|nr:APC family permease [Candidatus Bathyarchaeota archaeon]MDH5787659.1 APC family permease [Candidatus Bathyarchaeota archaeon]
MASSKTGLFAREATGLVREIGFMLGVILILSHVVGLGWQKRAFQFTGAMPVPNDLLPMGLPAMFWAFLFCGLIVLITGYTSGYVTASMPRSGGGYVTISRVIHPIVGYMAGWLMFLAEAFSYGLIGVACFEAIMIFFNIAGYAITFDATMLFVGGIVIVWVFAILALLGTKLYGRLMEAMFWIPAAITVGFFGMWIAGILNPGVTGPLATGVQQVMGATPQQMVDLAIANGMTAEIPSFFDAFSYALPGAFWAYMGWYATTFVAGEVKEANKKLPMVVVSAGLLIMIVYLAASSLSSLSAINVAVTPSGGHDWSFFQAYSWLSYTDAGKAVAVAPAIPNFQAAWSTGIASFIAQGMGWGWLSWLIAIAGVLWLANDIPPFLLVASRTFFAMSFDRMLPESFAYVSERWHAPVWSIIITAVAGVFGCIAESNVADLGSYFAFAGVVGTDIFDALFLMLFCVSCMLLPLERKEIFDRAAVKHSIGTIVTLGFVASILSGFCLFIFVRESPWILNPSGNELYSSIGFFLCIILGLLLYIYHLYRNTTRGVDVRTLYLSIPPE